jgi:hypothetical protein
MKTTRSPRGRPGDPPLFANPTWEGARLSPRRFEAGVPCLKRLSSLSDLCI